HRQHRILGGRLREEARHRRRPYLTRGARVSCPGGLVHEPSRSLDVTEGIGEAPLATLLLLERPSADATTQQLRGAAGERLVGEADTRGCRGETQDVERGLGDDEPLPFAA